METSAKLPARLYYTAEQHPVHSLTDQSYAGPMLGEKEEEAALTGNAIAKEIVDAIHFMRRLARACWNPHIKPSWRVS